MSISKEADDAFAKARSLSRSEVPPGWYALRVLSAKGIAARTGNEGVSVEFAIADGPYRGLVLSHVFWLNGKAVQIAVRDLETIGFEGLAPSQIVAFQAFESLPTVRGLLGYHEYQGKRMPRLRAFTRDTGGAEADVAETAHDVDDLSSQADGDAST